MHIIALFFPIFWKFPEAAMMKSEQEEGQEARAEGGVEVDEKR